MKADGLNGPNKLKKDLADGKFRIGATITMNSPIVAELLARVGFDWLWFEMEHTAMSVEAVQSFDIRSGQYSAEYGKGSAGVMAIESVTGSDKLRFSGTNFIPGLENKRGWMVGGWTPRFGVSGPIHKGRAWFANTVSGFPGWRILSRFQKFFTPGRDGWPGNPRGVGHQSGATVSTGQRFCSHIEPKTLLIQQRSQQFIASFD